jgi:hypothetical protein
LDNISPQTGELRYEWDDVDDVLELAVGADGGTSSVASGSRAIATARASFILLKDSIPAVRKADILSSMLVNDNPCKNGCCGSSAGSSTGFGGVFGFSTGLTTGFVPGLGAFFGSGSGGIDFYRRIYKTN